MSIIAQLKNGAREINLPATIKVSDDEIECVQMLRLLPKVRATMRARWRGQDILLKLLPDSSSARRVVRREIKMYSAVNATTIATPKLLFSTRTAGLHAVAYAWLDAVALSSMWNSAPDRVQHLKMLLQFFQKMHRSGLAQHDPHMNNFMFYHDEIYAVDLSSIKRNSNLSYGRWQRNNVADLRIQIPHGWSDAWQNALAVYPQAHDDIKLSAAVTRARSRRQNRYLKKCMRAASEFACIKEFKRTAVFKNARRSADLDSFLRDPNAWMKNAKVIKDGNSATVVRTELNSAGVIIKRNNIKFTPLGILRLMRESRAKKSWRAAHLLIANSIKTPMPIAYLEQHWGPICWRSFYVCEFINAESVAQFLQTPPNQNWLHLFAQLFSQLKTARISHGDMKASNLLMCKDDILLIDLESLKCSHPLLARWRFQKDRARFLKNWRNHPKIYKLFAAAISE